MGLFGKKNPLSAPPSVGDDPKAAEILRACIVHGDLHVVLRHDAFEDDAAWGLLLVDLARHVANARQQADGRQPAEVLRRIREGFDAEWESPTDEPRGEVQ